MRRRWPPGRWVQTASALGFLAVCACAGRPASKPAPSLAAPTPTTAASPLTLSTTSIFAADASVADASVGEPIAQQPRFRAALAAADRLLGGDLARAEQECSNRPMSEREACVDAFLERRYQERTAEAARSLRPLVLLRKFGESTCTHATRAKHDECVLAAMEERLKALALACPDASADLAQECIEHSLNEENGR